MSRANVVWNRNIMTATSPEVTTVIHYARSGRILVPNRLNGPARVDTYADGTVRERWFVSGIAIPAKLVKYVERPDLLTLDFILSERNAQRRMFWIKHAGAERILGSNKLKTVDSDVDQFGQPRRLLAFKLKDTSAITDWRKRWFAESLRPIAILEVHNSTPPHEPFALFVPSEMRTCAEAVAWTFPVDDIEDFQYDPEQES